MKHKKGLRVTHEFAVLSLSDEHCVTVTENNIPSRVLGLRGMK
jgi:hypothetical protein